MTKNQAPGSTPMMKQYMAMKEKYPGAILFFRMGDFYEMFFEDAKIASGILEIALTSRNKSEANPVPMCGIPYHAVDNYMGRLIKAGLKVAVCEQVEDPKTAKGIVKRDVVRVVTPGTVLDASLLEARDNNFLASVYPAENAAGMAVADVSTGEFRITEFSGPGYLAKLQGELEVLSPKEILVPENSSKSIENNEFLPETLKTSLNYYSEWAYEYDFAYSGLTSHFKTVSLEGFGCEEMKLGTCAAGAVIQYLTETQKTALVHMHHIRAYHDKDHMVLDAPTIRNLELTKNSFDGSKAGSLVGILDLTATSMGGRMFKDWILKPLKDLPAIQSRHATVAELAENSFLRMDIREALKSVYDMERIMARVSLGAGNGRDLASLKASLEKLPYFRDKLQEAVSPLLKELLNRWDNVEDIHKLISDSIVDEPPMGIKDGGVVRDGYSEELDALRVICKEGKGWIASQEVKEKEKTGINTLKIRYNKIYGYYIEVTKKGLEQGRIPDDYIRKQSLVNAERYISPELKEYESKVLNAEEKSVLLEEKIFKETREKVAGEAKRIQQAAGLVATLDVLAALAEAAVSYRYVRPVMTDVDKILIKEGRHPVIEQIPGSDPFVPNDTTLDGSKNQIAIITGPNMAGKSTYMRQVALIVLMAQMGSFVPAAEAEIGLVDRIFTRVGAQDNLTRGQSTFMVEMNETANILNNASNRSLAILDEIGRGTSTFDGLSIAWAVVEYLHNHSEKRARTLFATHYHELTELSALLDRVKNYNILVREWNDEVIFLRKIQEGGADKSYGIQVARLAGLPEKVLQRAREVLSNLENREYNESGKPRIGVKKGEKPTAKSDQMDLFASQKEGVLEELRNMDINTMTPLEAMKALDKLKKKL